VHADTPKLVLIQICRRFGPVGGMERYVWELCHELAAMGHQVHVLCEKNLYPETLKNVQVHELGAVRPKPRWLAHVRFSHRVHGWLEQHHQPEMIIHSHERTQDHHITTFHGPPFAKVLGLPLWKRLSLRIKMNLWLEKREVCNPQVQMIVPNSKQIARDLKYYYPTVQNKLTQEIAPGVGNLDKRLERAIPSNAGVIGFVGKEWKRKGLKKAIDIVANLAKKRPDLKFLVAGPHANDVQALFKDTSFSYSLLGETDVNTLYPQLDILLHPAITEPYGMVITEALVANVPVVISDICGASADVTPKLGSVLSLNDTNTYWADTIGTWLDNPPETMKFERSWKRVTSEYICIYLQVKTPTSTHST